MTLDHAEVISSLVDIVQEEPDITNGKLALALCEIYPELTRDEVLDIIEAERGER
jgi:hypothetical protein